MNIEQIRKYCLDKKGVTEGFPFDDVTLVFKVMNKIFCLSNLETQLSINLKCDPENAIELREQYEAVQPGYHMNKKHWNTIVVEEISNPKLIREWIDNSYNLVAKGLTKMYKIELLKL